MRSLTLGSRKVSPSNASILASVPSAAELPGHQTRPPQHGQWGTFVARQTSAAAEQSGAHYILPKANLSDHAKVTPGRLAIDLPRLRKYGPALFGA
jgi:hypothetical protein